MSTANKGRFALWPVTITQSIAWNVAHIQQHGMVGVNHLSFHCRLCGAPSGVACSEHRRSDATPRWCSARALALAEFNENYLKTYGKWAELIEQDARGKSWLDAREAIDKAPAMIK